MLFVTSFLTGNKNQDGGRPPFWTKENLHNSAAIWDIFTKFGVLEAMDSPQHGVMSFLGYNKIQDQIQDGGQPPSSKSSNGHISATLHPIHFMFVSRVNMIQTAIIKQQIFILKNCRFKYTCNDDNSIGCTCRKQQKLVYHVVTCKFPITSLQCQSIMTL